MNEISSSQEITPNDNNIKPRESFSSSEEKVSVSGKLRYKLINYIIVAEFDIDTGSEVRIQYPSPPVGYEESLFAEMMLPDGVHKREDDWTLFFLNRKSDLEAISKKKDAPKQTKKKKKPIQLKKEKIEPISAYLFKFELHQSSNEEKPTGKWVPLDNGKLSTVNIVIEERNSIILTCSSGDIAKISSHINFEFSQIEPLFTTLIAEDGTPYGIQSISTIDENKILAHLSSIWQKLEDEQEEISDVSSDKKEISEISSNEKIEDSIEIPKDYTLYDDKDEKPFFYCLNRVQNVKDSTVRRGAVVKAMAFVSRFQFIHIFKPILLLALDAYYKNPSEETISYLFNCLNHPQFMGEFSLLNNFQKSIEKISGQKSVQASIKYQKHTLQLALPTYTYKDEVADYSVMPLIEKIGKQIMIFFNAIFYQKRILFVGKECATNDICGFVMSVVYLVSPPLSDIIERVYPYTNLTNLEFLSTPGYIAGVANPVFEDKPMWWDILYNIESNEFRFNPSFETDEAWNDGKREKLDDLVWKKVEHALASKNETQIKQIFQTYAQTICNIAFEEEIFPNEATKKQLCEANKNRLDQWRKTLSYQQYIQDREDFERNSFIKDRRVAIYVKKLFIIPRISVREIAMIYQVFVDKIVNADQLSEFYGYITDQGGLPLIAQGLFSAKDFVKRATVILLKRIEELMPNNPLHEQLNSFILLAYNRLLKEYGDKMLNVEKIDFQEDFQFRDTSEFGEGEESSEEPDTNDITETMDNIDDTIDN